MSPKTVSARIGGFGIILWFCIILLTSCTPSSPIKQIATLVNTVAPTDTNIAPTLTPLPSPTPLSLPALGRIAFVNERGWVSVINADGTNLIELNDPHGKKSYTGQQTDCNIAWSPDGKQIAYEQYGNYALPADGSKGLIRMFKKMEGAHCVRWSFNGNYLAGITVSNASPSGQSYYTKAVIVHRSDTDVISSYTNDNQNVLNINWSPNAYKLAFDVDRKEIYILNYAQPFSIKKLPLTHRIIEHFMNPVWSPDGKMLAFEGYLRYINSTDIFIANEDGSNTKQLTGNEGSYAPAWSPDGKWIAYKKLNSIGDLDLMLIDPISRETHILATANTHDHFSHPSWSPDGRYIAYESDNTIQIVEVSTGHVTSLAKGTSPVWSPNTDMLERPDDCTAGWTKLVIYGRARVAGDPSSPSNRVRSGPSKSEKQIGGLQPGEVVDILDGPVCADGLVYWLVSSNSIQGGSGWTAEGNGTDYWLEPYTP